MPHIFWTKLRHSRYSARQQLDLEEHYVPLVLAVTRPLYPFQQPYKGPQKSAPKCHLNPLPLKYWPLKAALPSSSSRIEYQTNASLVFFLEQNSFYSFKSRAKKKQYVNQKQLEIGFKYITSICDETFHDILIKIMLNGIQIC